MHNPAQPNQPKTNPSIIGTAKVVLQGSWGTIIFARF